MYNNQATANGMYGNFYQMPQRHAKFTQPLSKEDIKSLQNTGEAFSLKVNPVDLLKSYCTHRNENGSMLQQAADGNVYCPICGATFNLIEEDSKTIQTVVDNTMDILQSVKTYYVDMPTASIKQYFQMMPLIEKLPKLYEIALKNFNEYNECSPIYQGGTSNGFAMLNSLTTPNGYGVNPYLNQQNMMMQQQNMMGNQQMMNPQMMQQQNMMNPNMVMNAAPVMGNGMGYMGADMNQQMQQPQAQMQQPQMQPQAQPAAPTQPAGTENVVEKNFNV